MSSHFEVDGRLAEFQREREDMGWRNRSSSLLDLDHMLGVIVNGLEDLGVLNDTYVIFTSDK